MLDSYILEQCKKNKEILLLKISNLEHAIKQSEYIIRESNLSDQELSFLRRKVADSMQDLEILYLIKDHNS